MLRATFRFLLLMVYTFWYSAGLLLCLPLAKNKNALKYNFRSRWAKSVGRMLGFSVKLKGQLPGTGCLLVGNHRSYIDPVVLMMHLPCTAVMKAEVASWPVIGWGATFSGILTVQRDNADSRKKVLEQMRSLMEQNFDVMIFPEGTSSRAPDILPFKKGAFTLAAEYNFAVTPFAIEYVHKHDAWVGNETFIPHFFKTFSRRSTPVLFSVGEPMSHTDADTLHDNCRQWIMKESRGLLASCQ